MLRVPEVAAGVSGAVTGGVVEIDVGDVTGQIVSQYPPTVIARLHEAREETGDRIVLVVVVRNEAFGISDRFMVSIQFTKVPPSVLVDLFPALNKRVVALNRSANERVI